ncbi:hypothetical protein [Lederbergia citri]|uniref:Uncharacterized protein n=1 Tax=Lederbergia citri TaxID=2833580 RepID=A0A942YFC8_9BACI|nr:hypothetical protein [Lederbergia citri]MBS4194357.1 hypothetical protein [Lederbergia citri]
MARLTNEEKLEIEKKQMKRVQQIRQLEKELISYCNKNRRCFIDVSNLIIYSERTMNWLDYKSEDILPFEDYSYFRNKMEEVEQAVI